MKEYIGRIGRWMKEGNEEFKGKKERMGNLAYVHEAADAVMYFAILSSVVKTLHDLWQGVGDIKPVTEAVDLEKVGLGLGIAGASYLVKRVIEHYKK